MTSALPTDHAGLAVLPWDDCLDRIRRARVGRVAFLHSGEPVILPVNHEMDGETIVFRSAPGSKLSAAGQDAPVSFEVDAFDIERRTGWSVVVRGTATQVGDPTDIARLNTLGVLPWADAVERVNWIRIRPYEITGRQIVRAATTPPPVIAPGGPQ
jgi:uncharacterized protein